MTPVTPIDGSVAIGLDRQMRRLDDDQRLKNKRQDLRLARLEEELLQTSAAVSALTAILIKRGGVDQEELKKEVGSAVAAKKLLFALQQKEEVASTAPSSVRYDSGP